MEFQSSPRDKYKKEPILVVATGAHLKSLSFGISRKLWPGEGLEALATYVTQSQESEHDIILVLGCRNPANTLVSTRLGGFHNIRKLDIFGLELTDNESIRRFATRVLETYPQQISVLLLCAGAMYGKRVVGPSGIEQTLQVNTLSQGVLLQCLWPRLLDSASGMVPPRVVFVASSLHKKASQQHEVSPSSIDTLLDNKLWKPLPAYSISKLVQMHLFKIAEDAFAKVEDSKLRPTAIAVSPGDISNATGFVPQTGLVRENSWLTRQFMTYIMPMFPFATSLEEGGKTIAQAMISGNIQSGTYLSPHGEEALAAECLDLPLRSAWRNWFMSNGVQID